MKKYFGYCIILLATASCTHLLHTSSKDDGRIEVNFVQVNDVYEIAPLANGKEGGIARVATLKKKYLQQNPNTLLVMAGDFISPSVYNSLKYEGKAVRGRQMIDAMNAAGIDLAVFGNHEFDFKESELQERINESIFQWVSSNTFHKQKENIVPFAKVNADGSTTSFPETYVKTFTDADGTTAKIGFIGLTLPFNKADYVSYTDAITAAKELYKKLKDSVDAVVAITHQSMQEDELLAKEIPGLAAILGGHEHDQRFEKVSNIYITKAMANAKSAYVVTLTVDKRRHNVTVQPKLEVLNETISLDSTTNAVVQKWMKIADNSYASLGFDAKEIVMSNGEPLDGRETQVRTHPTNLTKLIISAMVNAAPHSDIVIMNAGSIRVDDILQMPLTQYDIIRSLPFGGGIREVEMKGKLLIQILEQGMKNKGSGGFLHYNESLRFDVGIGNGVLNNNPLEAEKIYRVALTDFLLTGGEANLGFLKPTNPDITKVYEAETALANPKSDIRQAIIMYLSKK